MKISFHFTIIITLLVFIFTGYYIEFLILMGIIIAHEFAHLAACIIYHQKVSGMNLTLVGGMLDVDLKTNSLLKQLFVYLAGIILNLIFLYLSRYINDPYYRELVFQYNLILIVFNILPIYPLDGFHIIEVLLSLLKDPFLEQKISIYISYLFLTGALIFFVFFTTSVAFWVIGFYLLYQNIYYTTNRKHVALKKIIKRYHYS